MNTKQREEEIDRKHSKNEKQDELVESFVSQTTLHGFHFVFESNSRPRRVLWTCLLLCCAAFLSAQVYISLNKYFQYETKTVKHLVIPKKVPFPAISICSQNMLRKSEIMGTEAQLYLDKIDPYKKSKGTISQSFDLEKTVKEKGLGVSAMLQDCEFSGQPCGQQNFSSFLTFEFGQCYTFNSGKPGYPIQHVRASGGFTGLKMALDVHPEEYYGPFSYDSTGLRVFLHNQSETSPAMNDISVAVSPGFNYEVAFSKEEIRLLEPPYKSKCGKKHLETQDVYSYKACEIDCYEQLVMKNCSCRTVNTEIAGGKFNVCMNAEQIACLLEMLVLMNVTACDCPRACTEVKFNTDVSFFYYPSEHLWDTVLEDYKAYFPPTYTTDMKKEWFRRRSAKVSLFYKTLVTEVTEEKEAYTISDIGGDIGGNMGLFLGCSVITVCEFIDFLVRKIFKRRTGGVSQGNQTESSEVPPSVHTMGVHFRAVTHH